MENFSNSGISNRPESQLNTRAKKFYQKKWFLALLSVVIVLVVGWLAFNKFIKTNNIFEYTESKNLARGEINGPIQWEYIKDLYFKIKDDYDLPIVSITQCEGGPEVIFQAHEGCCGGPTVGYPPTYNTNFDQLSDSWVDKHADDYVCSEDVLEEALVKSGYSIDASFNNILHDDGVLYAGTNYRTVQAIKAETGEVVWETDVNSYTRHPMLQDDETLYIPIDEYSMQAVNKKSGVTEWTNEYVMYSTGVAPGKRELDEIELLKNGNLLLYNTKEKLAIIADSTTGEKLSEFTTFEGNYSDAGGVLYFWYAEYEDVEYKGILYPAPIKFFLVTVSTESGESSSVELAIIDEGDPKDFQVISAKDNPGELFMVQRDRLYSWELNQSDLKENKYSLYHINKLDGSAEQLWMQENFSQDGDYFWGESIFNSKIYQRHTYTLSVRNVQTGELLYTIESRERDKCVRSNDVSGETLCLYTFNNPAFYDENVFNISNSDYVLSEDKIIYYNRSTSDVIDDFIAVYSSDEKKIWTQTLPKDQHITTLDLFGEYMVVGNSVGAKQYLEIKEIRDGTTLLTLDSVSYLYITIMGNVIYYIEPSDQGGNLIAKDIGNNNELWSVQIGRPVIRGQISERGFPF